MLYVHRRGRTRALSNEHSLYSALSAVVPRLRRVELDGMPLVEQMRTVASSGALIGVFGQALTWMLLLPPLCTDREGDRDRDRDRDRGGTPV